MSDWISAGIPFRERARRFADWLSLWVFIGAIAMVCIEWIWQDWYALKVCASVVVISVAVGICTLLLAPDKTKAEARKT